MVTRATKLGIAALTAVLAASGCSLSNSDNADSAKKIVLITHSSWAMSKDVLDSFTTKTGISVDVRQVGDGGELASKLAVSDAALGDVAFGIDNTFASRVLDAGSFAPYTSPSASGGAADYAIKGSDQLTAIDRGDVCLNIDSRYYAGKGQPEPTQLADLTKPEYRGQTVVEDPSTSSTGMAFLLATIAKLGDGWQDYWKALRGNDVSVVDGWTQAYSVDFSGSSGAGPRPIVVSYASSPPSENGATKALLDTCFQQVEYAGVLKGAANADGAKKFIDFLLSDAAQNDLPGSMYVYPVQKSAVLPADWVKYAPVPPNSATMDPKLISDNRDNWQKQWRALVTG